MVIQVREKTIEEIEKRLAKEKTDLNKINYLESGLKQNFTFEIKRFIWGKLVELYEARGMLEKAGFAMANKAGTEISFREKIESYLKAAELYAKCGKIENAEEMFVRALRNANLEQKQRIKLARKNIFFASAKEMEKKGKKAATLKFYEKLIQMDLNEIEKKEVKSKLIEIYKKLGRFSDAKLVEKL